jgi:hypothetical protein
MTRYKHFCEHVTMSRYTYTAYLVFGLTTLKDLGTVVSNVRIATACDDG